MIESKRKSDMPHATQNIKNYYEELSQNAFKGEAYVIKFKKDQTIYRGIPIHRANLSTGEDDVFTLDILEPHDKKGVAEKLISDIEYMEKEKS
jgi:hypothetical protein